ncbi:MAG: aspartate aminotransferase family protein [Promethearchaeota archaeon]
MEQEIYSLEPRDIPAVETPNRRIRTQIPVPESIPVLRRLREVEPVSMRGQPPVVWDRAEGFSVFDRWGNRWIDFSSGVLVANAGHGREAVRRAIISQTTHGLLHNYCFASEVRLECCEKVLSVSPSYLDKVFLLTTGSEATECALKLARTHGHARGGRAKNVVVSFEGAFHGRTMGAQMMGGIPKLKEWIVHHDPDLVQVPFPDGYYNEDLSFESFERALASHGVAPERVCAVITETYQGGGADFLPVDYARALREWCTSADALLVFDEVQAGFGRTGKMWGFEHYGVEPDLVCMGKGITSGLPGSGVLGRGEIMDLYPPGSMTSTHTGNPLTCAAIVANVDLIVREGLVENAARVGAVMQELLRGMVDEHECIGVCHGRGLVAGLQVVKPGTREPDKSTATEICRRAVERGVMLFSPVGKATLKICPPLCITEEAVREGCAVLDEAVGETVGTVGGSAGGGAK